MCVLLVEDEDLIRMILTEVLTDAGMEVIAASDAESALAMAGAETASLPRVIVTDVDLGPGMNGFALMAAVRCRWPKIPVLLMSGRGTNFASRQCGKAERFLAKPFLLGAFLQAVAELVGEPEPPHTTRS